MIKIQRIAAPAELTSKVVADKTALFIADPEKTVWREPYIEKRLMQMSHGKCCYCECKLMEESNYMEVEHFHPKDKYKNEVVVWDNLLPACRACNGHKGTHDTRVDPIINPTLDDPRAHIYFSNFRYKWKTTVGKETVVLLHLNDTEKRCKPRYSICNELMSKVDDFLEEIQNVTPDSRTQDKNRMRNKVLELLENCQCDRVYTAMKATTIANYPEYTALVSEMKSRGLWTQEHEDLDVQMRSYALDKI